MDENVAKAVAELDAAHDGRFAPWNEQWQTIRARLVELEAENERLQGEVDRRFGIGAEMIVARRERDALQSRLAAAHALLREIMDFGEDRELHIRIQTHLSENGHDRA